MMKIKIPRETIGKVAKASLSVVCSGLTIMAYLKDVDVAAVKCFIGKADYGDTVDLIMRSNMFSSDKKAMIELLKKDADAAYYKAAIQVIKSNMFSSDKIDAIKALSED